MTTGYCQTGGYTADPWYHWAGSNDCGTGAGTTTAAWSNWVDTATVTATTTAWSNWTGATAYDMTGATATWRGWVTTDGTTDMDHAMTVWVSWQQDATGVVTNVQYHGEAWAHWAALAESSKLTNEQKRQIQERLDLQRRQQEEARLRAQQQAAEYEAKRKAAAEKAEALLMEHLTPEQREAWVKERAVFVTSQSGKRYKVKNGVTHNFYEVDAEGKPIKEFCAHLGYGTPCPVADNVLAQILALRFAEAMIVKKANVWDLTTPERKLIQRSS